MLALRGSLVFAFGSFFLLLHPFDGKGPLFGITRTLMLAISQARVLAKLTTTYLGFAMFADWFTGIVGRVTLLSGFLVL